MSNEVVEISNAQIIQRIRGGVPSYVCQRFYCKQVDPDGRSFEVREIEEIQPRREYAAYLFQLVPGGALIAVEPRWLAVSAAQIAEQISAQVDAGLTNLDRYKCYDVRDYVTIED